MIEKTTIDILTQDSVSIKKQKYMVIDGVEYTVGESWRRAYSNSMRGRKQVQEEVTEPYLTSILGIWGDTPTVEEITE